MGGDIRTRMRQTLEPDWHPLVGVRLEEEGQTYTFTKADGDKFKVLIITPFHLHCNLSIARYFPARPISCISRCA